MEKKDYEELCHAFDTNKTGLDHIDKHVYVKMFGYRDVYHYYDYVSLDVYTSKITVPLFAFGSIDDQLCGSQFTPYDQIEAKGSQVFLANSSYGGHACHMEGMFKPVPFYQQPCMEFLNFMESKLAPPRK